MELDTHGAIGTHRGELTNVADPNHSRLCQRQQRSEATVQAGLTSRKSRV